MVKRLRYILIILLLLFPFNLYAGAPSRSYTYTTGKVISPSEVTTNEDNIFNYLTAGIDTYADSSIVSADIVNGTIVSADIADDTIASADILDGTIINADISSSAAIADSKLAQITTASKVSGAALTSLSSIPSGAGQAPVANLGTGTGSTSNYLRGDGSWQGVDANTLDTYNSSTTAAATVIYVSGSDNYLPDNTVEYDSFITAIPKNIQVFTSSGTWTRPTGVNEAYIKVWGGGGGGNTGTGGGGGGGGYSEGIIAVTGNVTVTVGAGGTAGNAGGTSSFAGTTTIQATGGSSATGGGAGGVGSNGTINLTGQTGGAAYNGGYVDVNGKGGDAALGGAGAINIYVNDGATLSGATGSVPGGGGSGGLGGGAGNTGGDGLVIVYY